METKRILQADYSLNMSLEQKEVDLIHVLYQDQIKNLSHTIKSDGSTVEFTFYIPNLSKKVDDESTQ